MFRRFTSPSTVQFLVMLGAALAVPAVSRAQVATTPGGGNFSNIQIWNFGLGPIPSSAAAGMLTYQNFGASGYTSNIDLNFTLQTLQLNPFSSGSITIGTTLGGNLAFNGAGSIVQTGSGGATTISSGIVLGSAASGLTFTGSGLSNTTVSGVIASNTSAPVTINLSSAVPNAGIVTLSGANTFSGGVVLSGGNLALGNVANGGLGLFDSIFGSLTVNGGTLQGTQTILGNVMLNSDLVITGGATATTFGAAGGLGLGGISGNFGLVVRSAGTGAAGVQVLNVANTYTGATTLGQVQYAITGSPAQPGGISINSAVGSILNTTAINVNDGTQFIINKSNGDSVNNFRVATTTGVNVTSGFVQVIGSNGFTRQDLGAITGNGGATTIVSQVQAVVGSQTAIYVPNLIRNGNGTFVFGGQGGVANADGLGNTTAAVGNAAASSNIFVSAIGGNNPALALVGGGGLPGTTTISILPYGLGDVTAAAFNGFNLGSGFVTIDNTAVSNPVSVNPNSVRLLRTLPVAGTLAGEYQTSLAAAGATDNTRINASQVAGAGQIVNSMFFGTTGATVSAGPLEITSGALASNVPSATVSAPVNFGAAGAGEAVVSVVGALGTVNQMVLSGNLTGTTLTKTGHGVLVLNNTTVGGNVFSSNLVTVNAGILSISRLDQLGIANVGTSSLVFNMHTFSSLNGGLLYTGAGPETANMGLVINSGHAQIRQTAASSLTWAGVISGAGALNVDSGIAGSTLILSGTNTITGGVRIGSATINTFQFSNDSNLGAQTGPITVNTSGTTTRILGTWNPNRHINIDTAMGATAVVGFDTNGQNSTWFGPLTGAGTIFKGDSVGTGTWFIKGANNPYTGTIHLGTTTVQGGTLKLDMLGDLNSASIQFGQLAAVPGTYVVDLSSATIAGAGTPWRSFANVNTAATVFTAAHSIQLGAPGAPVDVRIGAGTLGSAAAAFDLSGFGKLIKTGTGTLTIAAASPLSFTGSTEIWGGTLAIGSDANLGTNVTNGLALMGGRLTSTASITIPATRPVSFGTTFTTLGGAGPANSIDTGANTLTFNSDITGPGAFEKTGAGTLALTGNNTFGNGTGNGGFIKLNQGNLLFTSDANLGALATPGNTGTKIVLLSLAGAALGGGGTLQLGPGQATTINRFIAFQNANTNFATIQVDAGSTLTYQGALVGGISTQTLAKIGPGALTFDADGSRFFGTISIGNGTAATGNVTMGSNGNMARTTLSLAAASGATFDMSNLTREFGSVNAATGTSFQLGATGQLITGFNNGAAHTWVGNILGGPDASVTKLGTGTLAIQGGGNTFGGGFHVLFGTTTLSGAGALPLQSAGGNPNAFTIGGWGDAIGLGTSLILDNATTSNNNRIADGQNVYINNSNLTLTTNATANTELINSLRGSGYSTVTFTTGGTLSFTDVGTGLTRVNNGTFLFRSGGTAGAFGTVPATAAIPNLLFANPLTLVGGGGLGGPFTVSILPYVVSNDTSAAGSTGNTFATYGANGIRPLLTASEFAATFAGATADTNLRVGASTTFTGANGIGNSLLIPGTANTVRFDSTGAEMMVISSGAIANTVTQIYITGAFSGQAGGIQVPELQTGLSNSRELIVHTLAANLNIGSLISTSGGFTKSGTGDLYLTNAAANTYTGGTTVNGGNLVVDSLGAINNAANTLTLGGGFLKYRGGDATLAGSVILGGGSATNAGQGGGFHVVSGTTLTLGAGAVSGFGGLNKDGAGVLVLQGANTFSGSVIINDGALAITSAAALGTNSRILYTSSSISGGGGATLRFDGANIALSQDFATFSGAATVGMGFDVPALGNNATLNGVISSPNSTRGITKFGAGDLTLTGANIYTGATQVFGGNLIFGGTNGSALVSSGAAGFSTAASFVANVGAGIVLDNSVVNNNNRLPDPFTTTIGSGDSATTGGIRLTGGNFTIRGNSAVPTSEVTHRFEVFAGNVTLENNGQNVTLTTGRVFRSSNLSIGLIRGTNLGSTPGSTTTNWFAIDMGSGSTGLGGAGGAAGTPFINILPGFMGDTSSTGVGTDLMTYDSRVGFRNLLPTEYTSVVPATNFDASRAPNAKPMSPLNVPLTTWVSSLKLAAGDTVDGPGTLNVLQSTILATGNSSINIPVLASQSGNGGYDILTPGAATNLTINSAMNGAALFKWGGGTLTLTNAYYGTGLIYVGQGTMQLSGANASLTPFGSSIGVAVGGTLDLGGFDRTMGALITTSGLGALQLNVIQDGTVALGGKRLTLYDNVNGVFSGQITGTTASTVALGIFNPTLTLTQPQPNFFGSVLALNGTFTLASTGSVLNASLIDLRGGSLTLNNSNDNQAVNGYVAQRVSASTPINLAGVITITANPDTPAVHNFGPITLVGGGTLSAVSGASAPTTVTISNLLRAANKGTLALAATNAGFAPSPIGNSRVFATQIDTMAPALSLVGGGGADGSSTVSIIPWAFNTTSGNFMTYGANGFRPLNNLATPTAGAETAPTISAAGLTENVRSIISQALTANSEINSFSQATAGGVTGAFDLTLSSGAFATTIGGTIGVNTNQLKTGVAGANTTELVVFNSAATTLNYIVGTTGGLTKHGGSVLTLGAVNPFTGGLTINGGGIAFNNDNQLGAAGQPINFGMPSLAATSPGVNLGLTNTSTTLIVVNRPITVNSLAAFTSAAAVPFVLNGNITGPGSLSFSTTTSLYEFGGTNNVQGDMFVNQGLLSIKSGTDLPAGTLQMFQGVATEGLFLRNNVTLAQNIHNRLGWGLNTNGFDATVNGISFGTGVITKNGLGTVTFNQPNPVTGAPGINAGTIRLVDRGALASGATVGFGAQLILDDSGTHYSDRIPDNLSITNNNGELLLRGNSSVTTEEVISGLTLGVAAKVSLAPATGQAAILRLQGTLTRSASSSILFRGTNLGVNLPGAADSANLMVFSPAASAAALTGGGGPAGSTAISVIAGAWGDTSATGLGTQLVTYDLNRGIRLLNASEYANSLNNGTVMSDNVHLTAAAPSIANPTQVNALWLDGGSSVSGAGTLTIAAGNILNTGTGNAISAIITTGGLNAIAIGGPGDLTINSVIPATSTGGLVKSGAGTLTLNAANLYTGTTTIAGGTVVVGNAGAFGAGIVRFVDPAIQAGVAGLTVANPIALSSDLIFTGNNDLTLSGTVALESATRGVNVAAGRQLTLSGVISGSAAVGGVGITKNGPGRLVVTNANTYSAAGGYGFYMSTTTVNAGELAVRNTTGSGTGGSLVQVNNSGTLSGTGFIIPTQGIVDRNTVTIAAGGTLDPGLPTTAGAPGVMTIGSATTPGITTATVNLQAGSRFAFFQNSTILVPTPDPTFLGLSSTGGLGNANPHLTVNGLLTIDPTINYLINGDASLYMTTSSYSYTIATATTVTSGVQIINQAQFDTTNFVNYVSGSLFFSLNSVGNTVYFNINAVPEPSTVLLICAAGAGVGGWIRRRRAAKTLAA